MIREDRYIVIKRKHLSPIQLSAIEAILYCYDIPTVESVVAEAGKPEYELTWQVLEKLYG